MHAAPSVRYPVGRSAFAAALAATLVLLGLAAGVAWSLQAAQFGWRQWLAFGSVAAGAGLALAGWWRAPQGVLRWDGAEWQWQPAAAGAGGPAGPGRVVPTLDLQAWLLLQWRPQAGRARWLWLARDAACADWDALRRAVYSRADASAPAPPRGPPPSAEQ